MDTEANDRMIIENVSKKDPDVPQGPTEDLKAINAKGARSETEYAPISYFSLYRYDCVMNHH